MDNHIECPNCARVISNSPIIDAAARGEGLEPGYLHCECGERITFWAITAQLRKQKTTGSKIQTWIKGLFLKQITKKE